MVPLPPQLGSFVLALLVLCRIRSIYKLVVVVAATGVVVEEVGIVEVKEVVGDVFFEWWTFGGLTADFERERERLWWGCVLISGLTWIKELFRV